MGANVEPAASAVFESWAIDGRLVALLLLSAIVYIRGWLRGRRLLRDQHDALRLVAFLASLLVLFLANDSPLDAFDSLFLAAHMTQHLLLMMIAPPLLLLSNPLLPVLRGLPKAFVKEGLGPFLSWKPLKQFFGWVTSPLPAWIVFAAITILWHIPQLYELALSSPAWHSVQHACFFWSGVLFWWPVIQPGPGKARWPKWMAIPYLLFADILNTLLSVVFVFSGHLLYPSYGVVRAGSLGALEDQSLAGLIMWVPGSIVYLLPAFVLVMGLFTTSRMQTANAPLRVRFSGLRKNPAWWKQAPLLRRVAQGAMLLVSIAVIADGFRGTQVAALNLAGVLPWIHWRALSMLALLVVGNLFCSACPFMLVRDGARGLSAPLRSRFNKIRQRQAEPPAPPFRWPRVLRNKWLGVSLIALYLWAYEAFSLWDSPWLTAWLITAYFAAAVLVDSLFRGASFCKYVCPVGQYHFVVSLVSPREIAVRDKATCQRCQTYDCIRGNEKARGCELYLFQPKKASNLDCTFCLDCVKACPHDNVGLLSVIPGKTLLSNAYRSSIGRLSKRADLAALVLLLVFGAFVNAAGMVAPVMTFEHRWHARLGVQAMPLIVGAFVLAGAVLLPLAAFWLCSVVNGSASEARRLAFSLAPLGVAMWAAHFLFHAASVWTTASMAWLQILLLDAGLLFTLYLAWRIAQSHMKLFAPWAGVACLLFAAGVWIFFQPMQMRGMMH
jgi:cytochrome c oxidase assembly factor CtaG/polyferredoxin